MNIADRSKSSVLLPTGREFIETVSVNQLLMHTLPMFQNTGFDTMNIFVYNIKA